MANIEKFKEAAGILQQVDVSAIITSMALGIAEAQTALDENSVAQTLILADPANGVGGVSLLELGFTPAFYHFQYADISAAISLKMSETTEFELDVSIAATYGNQGGFSQSNYDYLTESQSEAYYSEFRSSRDWLMETSESASMRVAGQTVQMNQAAGCIEKVESFADSLRAITDVERVNYEIREEEIATFTGVSGDVIVENVNGYISIYVPVDSADTEGILKVSDYDAGSQADLNGPASGEIIDLETNFQTTMDNIDLKLGNSGTLVGFTGNQIQHGNEGSLEKLEILFDFDKFEVDSAESNIESVRDDLMILVKALDADPSLNIQVIGHTDGSGEDDYNVRLSRDRANKAYDWFISKGVKAAQLSKDYKGEDFASSEDPTPADRRVEIKILNNADYFYLKNGDLTVAAGSPTPDGEDASGNGFVYAVAGITTVDGALTIEIGADSYSFTSLSAAADVETQWNATSAIKDAFSLQIVSDTAYLLQNKAQFKWSVFSSTSEQIEVETQSSQNESTGIFEDTLLIDQGQNASTRLASEASNFQGSNQFAIGGTVDVRVARAFSMSVEGNASMSARLVSLPAPPDFLDKIKDFLS